MRNSAITLVVIASFLAGAGLPLGGELQANCCCPDPAAFGTLTSLILDTSPLKGCSQSNPVCITETCGCIPGSIRTTTYCGNQYTVLQCDPDSVCV